MRVLGNRICRSRRRRGVALIYATVIAVTIGGLSLALLLMNVSTSKRRVATRNNQRAFYAAEAGLSDAFMQLDESLIDVPVDGPAFVGTFAAPQAFGTSSYWVEIEQLNSRTYSLTSTGIDGLARERLQLVLAEAPSGFFQWAAFGSDGVVLDSNAFIDSYDSALGTYDSQVQGGNSYARENGHLGSNADIELKANTEVHGDARPGPGGVVDDSAPGTFVSGSTEPTEEPFEMPPIEVPLIASSGTIPGDADVTLGPGPVHYDSITMNGGSTLTVRGPATLVVDDLLMKANSALVFDASNGPIEVHGTGDFELLSNSDVSTISNTALDVTLLLSGNNTTVNPPDRIELSSNSEFVGAIYAPDAEFSLASNFNIFGSIVCGFLDLSSMGMIHYDEALMYDGWGSTDEYEPALWRRMSPE